MKLEDHSIWTQVMAAWLRSTGATRIKHSAGHESDHTIHFRYRGFNMVVIHRPSCDPDRYGDVLLATRRKPGGRHNVGIDTSMVDINDPSFDPIEFFRPLKKFMDGDY